MRVNKNLLMLSRLVEYKLRLFAIFGFSIIAARAGCVILFLTEDCKKWRLHTTLFVAADPSANKSR